MLPSSILIYNIIQFEVFRKFCRRNFVVCFFLALYELTFLDYFQLLDIRVGVLSGSAVEGVVRIINPRLYHMSQSYQQESTDKAIKSLV